MNQAAPTRGAWSGAVVAGLVSALIMSVRLGDPGFWIDEIFTARWTRLPVAGLLAAVGADLHPPLFFLIERLVARAGGEGEAVLRFVPLLAGAATATVAYWAFHPALGARRALWVSWAVALSPGFALYARMARYYSLAALFALVAHGLFARLSTGKGRLAAWALYAVTVALALSTSYLTVCLIAAHGLWALGADRSRRVFLGWLAAVAAAALLLAPWGIVAARQIGEAHALMPAVASGFKGWVLMLGYELHALVAGEVLFPWEPAGALALLSGVVLLGLGMKAALSERPARATLLTGVVALLLASALVAGVARATPFVGLPARTLYLWPFAAALGVLGASGAKVPGRLLAVVWGAAMLVGWLHLYAADHALNPIYLTPGREAAEEILRATTPSDAVLAEVDTGVSYYLERRSFAGPIVDPIDTTATRRLLAGRPGAIWWAHLSRDGSARSRPETPARILLGGFGFAQRRTTYGWVDPTLANVKRRLLGVPGYTHRLVLERYVPKI